MKTSDAKQAKAETRSRYSLTRIMLGDKISAAAAEIAAIADFDIPVSARIPFVEFTHWINQRPSFIAEWRNDPALEAKHYMRFMQGVEACRAGYAASTYHLDRLASIEDAVHAVWDQCDCSKSIRRGTVVSIGPTRRWDFEYQAFVLAYRRALDGLAWGLSTYFKVDQSSFSRLAKHLPGYHPKAVADALTAICAEHIGKFNFVIGTERGRSVRDRIAHREAVQAGAINLTARGHRILGGGENLGIPDLSDHRRLSEVLEQRLTDLQTFIAAILESFRAAVDDLEGNEPGPK